MGSYPYFIELRLGCADPKIRGIIRDVQHRFRLGRACHRVPHMTIFGPFDLKAGHTLRDVKHAVEGSVAQNYELPFVIDGWDEKKTPHGQVISFRVNPSAELKTFRRNLSHRLCPITVTKNAWDCDGRGGWFHITLAMHLKDGTYRSVREYVNGSRADPGVASTSFLSRLLSALLGGSRDRRGGVESLYLPASALRVTILTQQRILAEYDLVQQRWLGRQESLSGREYSLTLAQYRKYSGIELTSPQHTRQPTEFVIGDLHLGHANIIRYCARPFSVRNVAEMDEVLIRNWNHRVGPADTVYYLGDLAVGDGSAERYLQGLNGKIEFIQGNHDDSSIHGFEKLLLQYSNLDLLLTHDPKGAIKPAGFSGWIIHGHTHNNDLRRYPFFDASNRKINVSAEVIGYQPVPLSDLVTLIQTRSDNIPTISDC